LFSRALGFVLCTSGLGTFAQCPQHARCASHRADRRTRRPPHAFSRNAEYALSRNADYVLRRIVEYVFSRIVEYVFSRNAEYVFSRNAAT